MKKHLFTALFLLGIGVSAQTYCVPSFANGCNDGDTIDDFQIPSASFSHLATGCSSGAYGDFTSQTINLNAGTSSQFTITHGYSGQKSKIWIDFNNDGTFDESTELVATGTSASVNGVETTTGNITIPATAALGNHRLRIADRWGSTLPIPCNTDGYGEAHDYTVNIGSAPACVAPTAPIISNITATEATISWTSNNTTAGSGYEFYYSTSNANPTATTVPSGTSNALSTTLSNLVSSTNYFIWVRELCSSTDKSAWSTVSSFTTNCATVIPNYTNDFSTFPGNCWSRASGGDITTGPTGTFSYWIADGFLNSGTSGAAKINIYGNGVIGWLKTGVFNLSAGNYRVKMDVGATVWADTSAATFGSDDEVKLLISNDGGTSWNVLHTWNANNTPTNALTTFTLDIPTYVSPNTVFALYGTAGTTSDAPDIDFFVDNFTVEAISLGTNEASAKKNIQVSPNPFSDVLTISNVKEVKSIAVMDLSGKVVRTFANPTTALQLGDLNPGMYLVVLNMNDGTKQTIKTIKK